MLLSLLVALVTNNIRSILNNCNRVLTMTSPKASITFVLDAPSSSRLSVISEKSFDDDQTPLELDGSELGSNLFPEESSYESSRSSDAGGYFQTLERNFTVVALKDAINQLIIANSGEKHAILQSFEKRKPMAERFNAPCRNNLVQNNAIDRIDDVMQRMVLVKLRNDTSRFRKILSDTCDEVNLNGTYAALKYYVEQESQFENEERDLIDNYVENKHLLEHLGKKYTKDMENHKELCYELDSKIHDLENEMQDIKLENEVKRKLVEKWEESRHEQARVILVRREQELNHSFESTASNRVNEIEIMKEIETFIQARIDSLNQQIDDWINKHETEVNKLDADINSTKNRITEIKSNSDDLKKIYDARQVEIEAYLVEREKKLAIKNFAQLQWNSAIKIQAWWRGCMVRVGLGPYKRKGKKPKKPKKVAGKGKKK